MSQEKAPERETSASECLQNILKLIEADEDEEAEEIRRKRRILDYPLVKLERENAGMDLDDDAEIRESILKDDIIDQLNEVTFSPFMC